MFRYRAIVLKARIIAYTSNRNMILAENCPVDTTWYTNIECELVWCFDVN